MTTTALSPETTVILIGAAIALVAILVLILARKLGRPLLIAGGLVAVIIFGRAMWSQAQATQEMAKAAEEAARTVTLLVVALVIVVILALAAVAFFWGRAWRAERRAAQAMSGGWTSDPNARWRRNAQLPARTTGGDAESLLPLLIGQMAAMQTMMMAWLQQQSGRGPVGLQPPPSLPAGQNYEEWVELPPDDWWNHEDDIVGGWP